MSCIDEDYQEYVMNPLREAERNVKWIIRQAERNSLTPRQMRLAIETARRNLNIADGWFEGME